MRRALWESLVLLAGVVLAPTQAAARTLTFGQIEWAPYAGDMMGGGLAGDFVVELGRALGFDVVLQPAMSAPRLLQKQAAREIDGVTALTFTPELSQAFYFARPHLDSVLAFLIRRGEPLRYDALVDLKGKMIAVRQGVSYDPGFDTARYLTREAASDEKANLRKLLTGRVDLVLIDRLEAAYWLGQMKSEVSFNLMFLEGSVAVNPISLALSRHLPDHQELIDKIDGVIGKWIADGRFEEAIRQRGLTPP